ncbi:MAG: 2,3-bisphosphoglycerate-independent phosphoglycerate mutase [Mollicutes bacterium PWAP]|nr:2,3-bisphosphoglycerate-independent phosphoglycerate mutase [Mollicutes bacterium PWAP]
MNKKPIVLTVIDGLGLRKEKQGNAFAQAKTPVIDNLLQNYPNSVLGASGSSVGLPEGQIGNSEVGHLNIGAGEIVYTGLSLIQKNIDSGKFRKNPAFLKSIDFAKKNKGTVQVVGLLSPGGVHSLEKHLFEIIETLNDNNVKKVTVHAFTDGRDVSPRSVKPSLDILIPLLDKYGYKLGSIGGRLYGMDRDTNYDKTELAYEAIQGRCAKKFDDIYSFIEKQYTVEDNNDEFIDIAINSDKKTNFYKEGDSVIFFNFRPDRARQLAHLFIDSNLSDYKPKNQIQNTQLTIMMPYEGINADFAFDSQKIKNPLGKIISDKGLKQLRISETQKYAHVTFFMDGGVDVEFSNSKRILIPSVKVDNFANVPKMSAIEIVDALIPELNNFDVVIMNFANPDMVGHTGNLKAAIKAVEILDSQIGRLKKAVDKVEGTIFITADHGNVEVTEDINGNPSTKHTTNDVFLICTDKKVKLKDGVLSNITDTILDYIGIEPPKNHTHGSLLVK